MCRYTYARCPDFKHRHPLRNESGLVSTETKPLFSYAHAGPFCVCECLSGPRYRALTRIGFLPSHIGPSVKRLGFRSCPRQAVAPNCMSGSSRCGHMCRLAGALTFAHLFGHTVGYVVLSDWTQGWLMLALLLGFLISAPCAAWRGPMPGGAALLGSSLMDNSDPGDAEFLRGLGAFAAVYIACVALFRRGGLSCAHEMPSSGHGPRFHRLPLCWSLSYRMTGEYRVPSLTTPCRS